MDGGNWNPAGPPGGGDKANIFNGGTAYIDTNAGTIQRFELAGPSGTTSGFLQLRTGGSLTTNNSGNTYVGARGTGRLTIDDNASLAIGPGSFYVGWRGADPGGHGHGTVIQNGGTVTMGKNIDLAQNDANTFGRYEIHGGSLTLTSTSAGYLQIGRQGTGEFVQTDGIVTLNRTSDTLMIGSQGSSTGTYDMSGGQLSVPTGITYVGFGGSATGTFSLSGNAQFTTNRLLVGHNGTGTLNVGGSASVDVTTSGVNFRVGNGNGSLGIVNQSGGTVTQNGSGAMYIGYESSAVGIYNISDGILDQGSLTIGGSNGGTGTLTQTGGDVIARRDVRIGRGSGGLGTYSISNGTLTILGSSGDLLVGRDGSATGIFNQSGGIVDVDRHVSIGEGGGNTGTYTMANGQLILDNELRVGYNGNGTFIQHDGDVTPGNSVRLAVNSGGAVGHYEIHNGTLTLSNASSGYLQIGRLGTGTFLQTGGTINVHRTSDEAVVLGDKSAGSHGTYTITGGQLNVTGHAMKVGDLGTGIVHHSGGAIALTGGTNGQLLLGYEGSGDGTYNLSGTGQVSANRIYVGYNGTGAFNQTGGTITTTGSDSDLRLGHQGSGVGSYHITNGTLDIEDDIYVGFHGTGTFTQDAGTIDSKTLLVARYGGAEGDVVQNDGTWTTREDASIGIEGRGTYTQNGGTVNVGDEFFLGQNSGGDGTYTLNAGALNVPNDHLYVSRAGGSEATFIQNGGDVVVGSALRMATDSSNTTARYEIHGGTVTVGQYFQVGRRGVGTLIQTGGTITANRGSLDAFTIGDKSDGRGTFETRGGVVNVPNALLTVGRDGIGTLDILGSNTDINANQYYQNNRSTLRAAIHNEGISRVDVASNATVSSGAMVDVDIWGGVLFTPFPAFELMRTATAGNIAGAFTVTDPEPIWSVLQDGTVVQAMPVPTLPAADLDPNRWFEVVIGGGAGSVTDMMPVMGLHPGEETWLAIDLVDIAGNDLSPAQIADLAAEMAEAGQDVRLSGWVLDAHPDYDMYFPGQPPTTQLLFGWDFSDHDPNVAIARVRAGIPEPATLALLGLGALALLRRRRR